MIPVFSNTLGIEEVEAFARVCKTRWLGAGPECAAFEDEFSDHLGVPRGHLLLTNCCTSALYLALKALGIGPGDEVIIPTIHFVGAANAVVMAGARLAFCDVDRYTLNATIEYIDDEVTKPTRAILLLHYGGYPCELGDLSDYLKVIEDAANAPASHYGNKAVGTLGAAGCWSFDAMKIMSMGDGGALWLANEEAVRRARQLRYLGLTERSGVDSADIKDKWWEFGVDEPSLRFTSNDLAVAIGREQLKKLPGFVARRREVWETYQRELAGVGDLRLPPEPPAGCTTSYYLYWIQTARRDELARYLYQNGVYTTFRYYPLHLVKRFGCTERLPNAEYAAQVTLNLPLHQNLTDGDVDKVTSLIRSFYQ